MAEQRKSRERFVPLLLKRKVKGRGHKRNSLSWKGVNKPEMLLLMARKGGVIISSLQIKCNISSLNVLSEF